MVAAIIALVLFAVAGVMYTLNRRYAEALVAAGLAVLAFGMAF